MPERNRQKIARNMVLGLGALYLAYQTGKKAHEVIMNFDAKEAAIATLRYLTEYDSKAHNGTVEGIAFVLPPRIPLDKRQGFAELVAAPDSSWRTVRESLIHGFKVTGIRERPCALDGLIIQESQELSARPRRYKGSLVSETVIRIVGKDLLLVPFRPGYPRYTDDGQTPL